MAGNLSEQLEKNYREQYYANHGEYPPEDPGCLVILFTLLMKPIIWFFKWMFKGIIWCFKWTVIGIYLGFKGIFYTFPRYLWRKGTVGKIGCGVYIFAWCVAIFVEFMGTKYISRNWLYLILLLLIILATAAVTITFRLLDKKISKRFLISLSSGIFSLLIVLIIGIFLTKDLIPLENEIPKRTISENTTFE